MPRCRADGYLVRDAYCTVVYSSSSVTEGAAPSADCTKEAVHGVVAAVPDAASSGSHSAVPPEGEKDGSFDSADAGSSYSSGSSIADSDGVRLRLPPLLATSDGFDRVISAAWRRRRRSSCFIDSSFAVLDVRNDMPDELVDTSCPFQNALHESGDEYFSSSRFGLDDGVDAPQPILT